MPGRNEIDDEDRHVIRCAVECAKNNRADIDAGLFDFFEQVMTLQVAGRMEAEFVLRFQQFTSPVMAKGVEDTAFYCYDRLTAMCEVGGDPARDGLTVEQFHAFAGKMQATHPFTMTTLSTHDTKRADDVRARLAVLSEMPVEFAQTIAGWRDMTAKFKTGAYPDANTEYFLFQTVIGAWPIDAERLKAYMLKAMREAKLETSWVANNKEFEDAMCGFIESSLGDASFVAAVEEFVAKVNPAGRVNSLTQSLLKQTAPGVPDLYQGSEIWDHSLVDPDNRRPVDYALRRKLLKKLEGMSAEQVMDGMEEGLPKLHLLRESLHLRREHREWFGPEAEYTPLAAKGEKAGHAVAFLRGSHVLTIATIYPLALNAVWGATTLEVPAGRWHNRLTGELVEGGKRLLAELLGRFPVALLVDEEK